MLAHLDNTDLDAGPRRAAGRERLCVVTREVKPTDEMIRFVAGPDRTVVPDLKRKLPGRGVWVTASRECLAAAVKRGVFARAFGADVTVATDLADQVQGLLERAFLDALAIARKAGEVVSGHAKVEAAAEDGAAVAFLQALEAGPEGVRQIMAAIRRGYPEVAANVPVIKAFTSAQLDLALARPNVVHAALLAGRATETVMARWRALARLRVPEPDRADAS
ncbi:MAG TPA: RNA-binding protein [Xanthobacteraceae bacterium]|nr:RNA-binding protein [Xanthobacteraceae bacterium]